MRLALLLFLTPLFAQTPGFRMEFVAIQPGEFRDVDPNQIALIMLGMTTSYFAAAPILSQVTGQNLLAPDAVAARKQAIRDFLDHGLAAKGAKAR